MSITGYLSDDHRDCDALFARAEQAVSDGDWASAQGAFAPFSSAMARHFAMEEEVLFPAFEEATGMSGGPPAVMRMEHEQMRVLLAQLAQAVAAHDQDGYLGDAETLLVMMQQHNMKEEQILYPMSDRALPAAELVERLQQRRQQG